MVELERVTSRPASVRGYVIRAFRDAAGELWGAGGLADIAARMPEASRIEAFRDRLSTEWIDEAHVIAWCFATWEGPAGRDKPAYFRFVQRQTDLGFGRVRRFLLSVATPLKLLAKAPELWSLDHSHGKMECEAEERRASLVLRDHPYTETPQARATIAEAFRYTLALTRAKDVTESHALDRPGMMTVRLKWK
jgi:hypothetical protein